MIVPPEYLKKKSKTIPFGYETSEITGYFKPIPEQLEVLNKYLTLIKEKKKPPKYLMVKHTTSIMTYDSDWAVSNTVYF